MLTVNNRPMPELGDTLFFWPGPAFPNLTGALPYKGRVAAVHSAHIVDLDVPLEEANVLVRFVPFLVDGDPDPASLIGRCQVSQERQPWIAPTFPAL